MRINTNILFVNHLQRRIERWYITKINKYKGSTFIVVLYRHFQAGFEPIDLKNIKQILVQNLVKFIILS